MSNQDSVQVIAIEGVHGCGKSTLCNYIRRYHSNIFHVLDESFIDEHSDPEHKSSYHLHPQSLVMEMLWTCKWFSRLVELRDKFIGKIVIVDRSPYSAMAYVQPKDPGRHVLEPFIKDSLRELREKCRIDVHIVYLRVESQDILYDRITKRLNHVRQELNEASRVHLSNVHFFYESMASNWDVVVGNEEQELASLERVFRDFERMIK